VVAHVYNSHVVSSSPLPLVSMTTGESSTTFVELKEEGTYIVGYIPSKLLTTMNEIGVIEP
jgi:hypothetical protein